MPRIRFFKDTGRFYPTVAIEEYIMLSLKSRLETSSLNNRPILLPAYTGKRVWGVVKCFRCERPRCVYATKPLSSVCRTWLDEVIENRVFSCGTPLLEVGHPLEGKVYTKPLQCDDSIERSFYCSHLADGNVCSQCGENVKKELNEIQRKRIGLVLPFCGYCKSV